MSQSRLFNKWRRIACDLGVAIDEPGDVVLKAGSTIRVELVVRGFGAEKGMLILTDAERVQGRTEEIIGAGYGYSVLSEPEDDRDYDREAVISMLEDWGYGGPESGRPPWLRRNETESNENPPLLGA